MAAHPVERVESLIQDYNLPEEYKRVIVIGKHLCGPGTDAGIDFICRHSDRMVGCVFATCCCCKITGAVGEEMFRRLYFSAAEDNALDLAQILPQVTRATSWRQNKHHTAAYPELVETAEFFESWIQGFRRRRLEALNGSVEEVLYCEESGHSQQNRCLVSGKLLQPTTPQTSQAFFELLNRRYSECKQMLPIDLRARGLVSAKYDHDGTALEDLLNSV